MNKALFYFMLLLTVNSAFGNEAKLKWVSIASTVDNGDVHNLLRCMVFENQGNLGVLLWKSSEPAEFDFDHEGNVSGINGKKIVLNNLCTVNYIDENFTAKCINSKKVRFSKNIRDYISPKLGIKIPIINFRPIIL